MSKKDFIWSEEQEPHFLRRKMILKEHPEVRRLFGTDSSIILKSLFVAALQLMVPIYLLPENPWLFMLLVLTIGATLNHILVLAIHEITHDLACKSKVMNNWLAIIVNFPLFVPFAMPFKAYHAEHHWYQGKHGIDTDIASRFEALIFKGFIGKFLWMLLQTPFYAFRPLFVRPMRPDMWQVINWIFQIAFLIGFYFVVGWSGLLYLFLSIALASGLHPLSGHFVAEHYVTNPGQETYSYYGWLNKLVFNVGYHNEHHDFPNIPGSKLPMLKQIGGNHYSTLHSYSSWTGVIVKFLTNRDITLFSRVKRRK